MLLSARDKVHINDTNVHDIMCISRAFLGKSKDFDIGAAGVVHSRVPPIGCAKVCSFWSRPRCS